MALRAIKDFPKAAPSTEDLILIEQQGGGRSTPLSELPVSTPVSTRIAGEVNTLNSRIDNIMASSGDDISEIVDARQGSDGTNYASLKARLDAEHSELKGDLADTHTLISDSMITLYKDYIRHIGKETSGKWANNGLNYQYIVVPVKANDIVKIKPYPSSTICVVLKSYNNPSFGDDIDFSSASGFTSNISLSANVEKTFTVPSDAKYIAFWDKFGTDSPATIFSINGYSILDNITDNLKNTVSEIDNTFLAKDLKIKTVDDRFSDVAYTGGLILSKYASVSGLINSDGTFTQVTSNSYKITPIPVNAGDTVSIHNNINSCEMAVVKTFTAPISNGETIELSSVSPYSSVIHVNGNTRTNITVPSDAKFILVQSKIYDLDNIPFYVKINGYDVSQRLFDNLNNRLSELHQDDKLGANKKVVIIGDSLMENANAGFHSWGEVVKNSLGISNLIGVSIGGTRFRHGNTIAYPTGFQNGDSLGDIDTGKSPGTSPASFSDWYRINLTIPSDADVIVFGTGVNEIPNITQELIGDYSFSADNTTDSDWVNSDEYADRNGDYDITTLTGAVLSTIMKLQVKAPKAKLFFCNWCNSRGTAGKNETATADKLKNDLVKDTIENICNDFGIELIDLFHDSGINPLNRKDFTADGIHLNTDGYKKHMAIPIITALRNYFRSLLNN